MSDQRHGSLDALADVYHPGMMVRFSTGRQEGWGAVVGFVYSLPLTTGGPTEAALIVRDRLGTGHVYPHEVIERRAA